MAGRSIYAEGENDLIVTDVNGDEHVFPSSSQWSPEFPDGNNGMLIVHLGAGPVVRKAFPVGQWRFYTERKTLRKREKKDN